MAQELTNREKYLIENFKLDEKTVKTISEIGRLSGTHKYDIWIAKEVKNDLNILNNLKDIQYIIDWANKKRPDITRMSFKGAFALAEEWHKNLKFDEKAKNNEKEDDNKILYRCRDGNHYFVLLFPEDLKTEGDIMRNCVGSYSEKVRLGRSLIVSLRDNKNDSHVTIEIDTQTGMTLQVRGKANTEPAPKYLKLITEFAIFASGYGDIMDKELLELMNMKFE